MNVLKYNLKHARTKTCYIQHLHVYYIFEISYHSYNFFISNYYDNVGGGDDDEKTV